MQFGPAGSNVHPWLRGLSDEWLAAVERCSTQSRFSPGQLLCRAGETAHRIHLLQSGHVTLEVSYHGGTRAQVATMGPGDVLACPSADRPLVWQLNARSFEQVTAQSILLKRLRRLVDDEPGLAGEIRHRLLLALHEQLTAARQQVAQISLLALSSQKMTLQALNR